MRRLTTQPSDHTPYSHAFIPPHRATALADLLGVDFALINRNRKRALNEKVRQAVAQAGGLSLSQTPSQDSLALPPSSTSADGPQDQQATPTLAPRKAHAASPMYSVIGNGVQANESGEFFITDDDGKRVFSGGARESTSAYNSASTSPGKDAAWPSSHDSSASTSQTHSQSQSQQISEMDRLRATAAATALSEGEAKMEILVGDVKDKVAILVDDMADTGRTLALAAKTLRDAGAKAVYAHITHGILSGDAIGLIRRLDLERLVVTNTIPNSEKSAMSGGKLEIMDISAVVAESIRRAHHGESIAVLFEEASGVMV